MIFLRWVLLGKRVGWNRLRRGGGGPGRDIDMEVIYFTIALGEEGGVEQILFRGCGGLRRDIEMEVIFRY